MKTCISSQLPPSRKRYGGQVADRRFRRGPRDGIVGYAGHNKPWGFSMFNPSHPVASQHDAYGAVVSSTGTWSGPFGYAGDFGYQEDASGLKLLGHRYYDSSTGRFLTRDPAKDGRNWYAYCENAPLTCVDPEGLKHWVFIVAGEVWHVISKGSGTIKDHIRKEFPGRGTRMHRPKDLPDHGHAIIDPPGGGPYPDDDISRVHVTTEKLADDATHPDWQDWRDKIIGLIPNPVADIRDIEKELEGPITDMVEEAKAGRQRSLEYWLSED